MSCRSEEKIICPWCGAEMKPKGIVMYETRNDEHPRYVGECWCSGDGCEASGPCVQGKDKKGFATREEAKEAARAAALRRYTPILKPLKPMTLEEVKGANRAWIEVMAEGWDMQFVEMNKRSGGVVYQTPGSEQLYGVLYDNYGKTWRCWERNPTDEERSAAGWET